MKNKVTNLMKTLALLMVTAIITGVSPVAVAQNAPCDARFDFKTDGYKMAVTAVSNTAGTEYTWNFGDGTGDKHAIAEHTYQKEGVYAVCLIVKRRPALTYNRHERGCADTVCKRVEVKAPCRIKVDVAFEVRGTVARFKSEVHSNANHWVYKWEFGNGNTSNQPHPEFDFKKPGVYKVCLTVLSRDGRCRETVCKVVEIKRDPCHGLQAFFRYKQELNKAAFHSTTSGQNLVYEWTINGRTVSDAQHFRFTFKEPGRYNVCLTVKIKGTDCVSRICRVVVVKRPDPCARLQAAFRYTQKLNKALFVRTTAGKDLVYEWTINGRKVSEKENFRFTFKEPGRYNVCLVVKIKGTHCVSRICRVVEVKRPDPCRIEALFRFAVSGNKVALNNLSKGNNLSYHWTVDGKFLSNRESFVTQMRPGKHRVCLTIGNGRCRETYCAEVEIKRPNHVVTNRGNNGHNLVVAKAPETPAANCNCQNSETAQNNPAVEMALFPNPAHDVLNLTISGTPTATIIISNTTGTVYYNDVHTVAGGEALGLPISHLPQGYYVAKVLAADGLHYATLKFYKQ